MKKLLKKFFTRTGLVILIIVFEILALNLLIYVGRYLLSDVKIGLIIWQVLSVVVEILLVIHIINKPEAPDFKVPWIVIMLILPIFGAILYLIFANHGIQKKYRNTVEYVDAEIKRIYPEREPDFLTRLIAGTHYGGTFRYLEKVTGMEATSNNRTAFFPEGSLLLPDLIRSLRSAEKFILIEMFIIGEGTYWNAVYDVLKEKAKAGVDVKIVYDDLGSLGTLSEKTFRQVRSDGIEIFKFAKFTPLLSGIYNNRDHRKIIVIDHKVGYTGGMNIADEYINVNSPYGFWKDTMVKIEGEAIRNLIVLFLSNYMAASRKIVSIASYTDGEYPSFNNNGVVFPFGDAPGSYDGNHLVGEQTYINLLSSAKKSVYISTPYYIPTHALNEAVKNAALRGVDVHLFFPKIPDKKIVWEMGKSQFRQLLDAGVKIHLYTPGFNHEKCVLVDDTICAVGTINFDYRSLVHHFECGAVLYHADCLSEIRADFDDMDKVSELVPANFRMNKFAALICALLRVFAPLL